MPGETDDTTFTATYVITQADIDAGRSWSNKASEQAMKRAAVDESDDPNEMANVDNNSDGEPDDPTVTILPDCWSPVI